MIADSPTPEPGPSETGSFRRGLAAGISVPPLMVFVAMIGFGSLAKSQGIGIVATIISAVGIYGLPGQVAMIELYATGASLMAITVGVSMANMRFLPMSIALMPHFAPTGGLYRWRYLLIQLMSINSWSYFIPRSSSLKPDDRLGFFSGFGTMCFCGGLAGSVLGWLLAGTMSWKITATLVFLNPAYFIFLFCSNRNRNILLSLFFGAVLGPILFQLSPDWSLPLCGLVAGTLGFVVSRKLEVKRSAGKDHE